MKRRLLWLAGLFGLLALALPALATAVEPPAEAPTVLSAEAVLASSRQHFPAILEAAAQRREALGKAESAEGEFDLVFSADGLGWATGFYDGRSATGGVQQRLRSMGATVYSKYRVSGGEFPVYQDERFTNMGGQVKAGAVFSLMRDRVIDAERFAVADAELAVRKADLDLLLVKIGVQQRALTAYWRWVAAGWQLRVYEDLLALARDREAALTTRVERGALARIFLNENRQSLLRRQALVVAARRDFETASNDLTFFYRTAQGEPRAVQQAQLPPGSEAIELKVDEAADAPEVEDVLRRRPEINLLRTVVQRAENRLTLSRDSLKPKLDFNVELASGLGGVGEGGVSRDSSDAVVGFQFSVPLQQRDARGRVAQAEAVLDAARLEQRQLEERIEIQLRNIVLAVNYAQQLYALAVDERTEATTLRQAEQRRFDSGASDFFLVNLREEDEADVCVRYYQAALNARIARATYDAATVSLRRLGLADDTGAGGAGSPE
ncbi:MAG TPA: multidrug transporter [Xanthomonadaceae bacterium]|jgi:outer membrane protein TolC|nr:multidrug transporter [Xanthomonadaceae bacterium]